MQFDLRDTASSAASKSLNPFLAHGCVCRREIEIAERANWLPAEAVLWLFCKIPSRATKPEVEIDRGVRILVLDPIELFDGLNVQARFLKTLSDGAVAWRLVGFGLAAGKLRLAGEYLVRMANPDENSTRFLDDGNADPLGSATNLSGC